MDKYRKKPVVIEEAVHKIRRCTDLFDKKC